MGRSPLLNCQAWRCPAAAGISRRLLWYCAPRKRSVILVENRAEFSLKGPLPIIRGEVECPGLSDVTLFRTETLPDDDKVPKADALAGWGSETVAGWLPTQLFLYISVPEDTAPGCYQGSLKFYVHRMFEDEILVEKIPFSVQVKDVVLPTGDDRKFHLVIWRTPEYCPAI